MRHVLILSILAGLAVAPSAQEQPDVFEVVEVVPQLIGGIEGLAGRVKYPEMARRAGIEGKVFVQFVVDEKGGVQQARCVRSPNDLLCEAAIRAVEGSRFSPGMQEGEPVKVRFTLPVDFKLRDSDDEAAPPANGVTATPMYGLPGFLGLPWNAELVEAGVGRPRNGTVKQGRGTLVYDDPSPNVRAVYLTIADGTIRAMRVEYEKSAMLDLNRTKRELESRVGAPQGEGGWFTPAQLGEPHRLRISPESLTLVLEHAPAAP